jgi:hypothetical protein
LAYLEPGTYDLVVWSPNEAPSDTNPVIHEDAVVTSGEAATFDVR